MAFGDIVASSKDSFSVNKSNNLTNSNNSKNDIMPIKSSKSGFTAEQVLAARSKQMEEIVKSPSRTKSGFTAEQKQMM
jgi:hypothetical protein